MKWTSSDVYQNWALIITICCLFLKDEVTDAAAAQTEEAKTEETVEAGEAAAAEPEAAEGEAVEEKKEGKTWFIFEYQCN